MFIDLEIGLLSVCVFRSGCAHFLFLFIFLFLLDTSIVALCLFPLNSANKRRTNEFAPEKNEHFTCFLSLAMCLFLSRWCCCLIGLHVSITRKSFGFEQANNRWDACRCFARKKRRFDISFFDEFWSGCRFDNRRPTTVNDNVCRNESCAKIVCYLSFCGYFMKISDRLAGDWTSERANDCTKSSENFSPLRW